MTEQQVAEVVAARVRSLLARLAAPLTPEQDARMVACLAHREERDWEQHGLVGVGKGRWKPTEAIDSHG